MSIIYKHYEQAALNRQFNNRLRVPDYAKHFERCEQWSRQTENKYPLVKDIAYGRHIRERLISLELAKLLNRLERK